MTLEKLRELARKTLDDAIAEIRKSGELNQLFYLVKRDGGMDIVLVDGGITNSETAKRDLSRVLKARVNAGEIEAVIMRSDIFYAETTRATDTIRQRFGMTVEQAANAGLCEKHEAVLVTLQSPILHQMARQEYRRTATGIELVGAPEIHDDSDGKMHSMPSRFGSFFPARESARTA